MRYYSKTTGCTYLESVHGQQMPADAVPIPEGIYLAVIANPAPGKIRSHDDGLPILIEPPPPSAEQLAIGARAWRDSELLASDRMIARHRDERDMGGAVTLTAEQFAELLAYRQALRDWPEARAFPGAAARPVPPDWLAS